ncbi:MAG: DNA (cytosine-5-)-methyltransferase [Bacteroidales bacterium]|nr:DNA (cytosine-5-)-methyltransferase [Bacteroidales bacterium]
MNRNEVNIDKFNMVSLFAGIGGFELAFQRYGVRTSLMCEIDPIAKTVLASQFPGVEIIDDVCTINTLPKSTNILCAGFPCQDLSSIGAKKGMQGTRSSLVKEVFRILNKHRVEWVVFENVSFMLSLNNGETIRLIANELEKLGYNWAYRTIDSISFVPQHRRRVYVVASLHNDPRNVILSGEANEKYGVVDNNCFSSPLGFYWTEGRSALGLIGDALPTLKAGSTIGIPSPPAIAFPDGEISTPSIQDAERIQGFPANWTLPAEIIAKPSSRWKLVGNAVTVDTVAWIAMKVMTPQIYYSQDDIEFNENKAWPKSAWGVGGERKASKATPFPVDGQRKSLSSYLCNERKPLSLKAANGFYNRLCIGGLHCPEYFRQTISQYIKKLENNGEY